MKRLWFEIPAAIICVIQAWFMAARLVRADGLILPGGQPLWGDFIAFWSAGRLALQGEAVRVYDAAAIRAQHLIAIPDLPVLANYNSPPTFLLLSAPLALLPYSAAAATFLSATAALYLYAARLILPDWRALLFALTLPAAVFQFGSVQTALLMAGLAALAVHWLDRRPIAAAAAIALMTLKPHLALLWPLLLVLTGRWRVLMFAGAFALALILAALALFGFETYAGFIANIADAQSLITDNRVKAKTFAALYGALIAWGAAPALALGLHAASAAAAIALASPIFIRGARAEQGAALCAATMLVSPYLFFYDGTLLALGAALLGAPRNRIETAIYTLCWAAGLSVALWNYAPIPLCPIAAWALLALVTQRVGIAAPRPAPAPRT